MAVLPSWRASTLSRILRAHRVLDNRTEGVGPRRPGYASLGYSHSGEEQPPMTTGITITPIEPASFGVQIEDGNTTSRYRVHVPAALLEDLGLADADRERLVRESFAFLLEREPPSSILGEFSLDVIPRYFPEYYDELRRRL